MLPILYSFRRCPYAIRARLALKQCDIKVEHREVVLADKPAEMLAASPKGTVPVLILPDGIVIDESLNIIYWALSNNDSENWLPENGDLLQITNELITNNDKIFKEHLDHYKYAIRFPEFTAEHYRRQGEEFLQRLDGLLADSSYLLTNQITLADIAIFPFIRQFAFVDIDWFYNSQYTQLKSWLSGMLDMELFKDVMKKYPQWLVSNKSVEL